MTIEIVDCPIKNGGSFHSYVKLPEGKPPFSYGFPMVYHTSPLYLTFSQTELSRCGPMSNGSPEVASKVDASQKACHEDGSYGNLTKSGYSNGKILELNG